MTASWQLVLLWGVLVGVGTGSISMGFVATVATRWFESRRGLVTGVLTAASATGQLIFLPVVAAVTTTARLALGVADRRGGGAGVVPLVLRVHAKLPAGQGFNGLRRDARRPNRAAVPASQFSRRVRRTA